MCGIIGVTPAGSESNMKKALTAIEHRGPDGSGYWFSKDHALALGHVRLSILDTSSLGDQPMHFENYSITFNGEVYNFIELKESLIKLGYTFKSKSDTEVILKAYKEWGPDCLLKFNGMWSFAIYDNIKQEVFISRDRFGQKPLYYALVNGGIVFASEAKALFPYLNQIKISKDFHWCKKNIYYYEGTEKCLVDKVHRFPPGNYATFDLKTAKFKLKEYWNTLDNLVEIPKTYPEQVAKFRELFMDSCKLRMRSDVPIGTALSGGLDSSAVSAAMNHSAKKSDVRMSSNWQKSFVACFPGSILDESKYAKMVVDHLGLDGDFFNISDNSEFSQVQKYINQIGEIYSTSPVPMIQLYKRVKEKGVTVTLDGHGADEALSGYVDSLYYSILDKPFSLKHHKEIFNTINGTVGIESDSFLKEYIKVAKFIGVRKAASMLAKVNATKLINNKYRIPYQFSPKIKNLDFFNSHLHELFHKTILPSLLRNYDRYSMIAGVESRMPFMDYRIVQFLFSLSVEGKIRNGYTKAIIRDAISDLLPEEVVCRKFKIGFNTPIAEWMQGIWKEPLLDLAHSESLKQSETVNGQKVKQKIIFAIQKEHLSFGPAMHAWTEITPFLWEQYYLKPSIKDFSTS